MNDQNCPFCGGLVGEDTQAKVLGCFNPQCTVKPQIKNIRSWRNARKRWNTRRDRRMIMYQKVIENIARGDMSMWNQLDSTINLRVPVNIVSMAKALVDE